MATVTQKTNEQVRFKIVPTTESGAPAKIDQQDKPLGVDTISGNGSGVVELFEEYTVAAGEPFEGMTGHRWEVVIKPGTGGTNGQLVHEVDADNDAGETRLLSVVFDQVTLADEAATLVVDGGTTEPLV